MRRVGQHRAVSLRCASHLVKLAGIAVCAALVVVATPSRVLARAEVSVQPLTGAPGTQLLRREVAKVVRQRGLRVTTRVPQAEGTGQYYTWARELGLRAFVSGEVESLGRRRRATFLVWSGHTGSVVGRWTVTAPAKRLPRAVARGFWPRLGRSLRRAQLPDEWRQRDMLAPPGPTLRIDAGLAEDESVRGEGLALGRRPLR